MTSHQDSTAVAVARAHVDAWSNHDFDKARECLAADVKIVATTTKEGLPGTNLVGLEPYMAGLKQFALAVEPGSAKVLAAVGDEHNALLTLTVRVCFAPGAPTVTLSASRLYLLDADKKIKSEQVIFFVA